MAKKPPRADDLSASREWVRLEFGMRGQYRRALRQVDRSLAAIAQYEYSFLLAKASLLSCLERWAELAGLLGDLADRYPAQLEVRREIAELFRAHGNWHACLEVLDSIRPQIRSTSDVRLIDNYYETRLACLYALGQTAQAIRQGRSIVKRLPGNSIARVTLSHIQSGELKTDPWAPKSAPYLKGLRRTCNPATACR